MLITKRQEKQLTEITKPLADLIKSITDAPEAELPALIEKNLVWETSKSSLLNWVPVLNRFDAILERITKKYGLVDENCKLVIFSTGDTELLNALLDFTHMLLDNSTNKAVYSSSHRLFDILNSPTVSVAIRAIKCLTIIGKRYMNIRSVTKSFVFERKLSERILLYAQFLPASTLTANTGSNDNLSLIDFIKETPQIPSKWKRIEYVFYPSDQHVSATVSAPGLIASQSTINDSPSIKRVRSQQSTPSPLKKKSKTQPRTVKGDKVEQYVMSEENVRKHSLQQIFDMGCEKVSPKFWLRFGLDATFTKAFNANSYENIKLRQDLVILKSLAVAFLVLVNNDFDVTSRVFEADPTLLSSLIDLINLQNSVPQQVRRTAAQTLECIAAKKTWSSEIVKGLGGSVSHGLIFQNLRLIIKQLKENRTSDIDHDFNLVFFNLMSYLTFTKSLLGTLVAAGLIQHLTEFVNISTDYKGTTAAAIHLLESICSVNSDNVTIFRDNEGFNKLISAIGAEVDFALANPGYAGGPPVISVVHYSISFKQANLLRALLRFVQHLIQKETGDRARNLFDSALLQHVNKLLVNIKVFGYTLLTLATNIVCDIIHNEPTSYPILKEAGCIDIIVENFESFFGKSADLLLSLPAMIGAIALNTDGMEKVKEGRLIQKLFTVFDHEELAKVLVQDDSSEFLGTSIDELARHYPDFKPIIEDEMIALIERLPTIGSAGLPRPHVYQSPRGSFYHSKSDEVIDDEEGATSLDTWESIESAYVLENAAVAIGNSIQSKGWANIMTRIPFQSWVPLIVLKNAPFDYLYSNSLYPINGALKFFDDERREYAPRELVNEISKQLLNLEDYLNSNDEKSMFQTLENDAEKSDDLLNRLISTNNILFTFVDVFCNPSSLSPTRVDQLATFFSDELGIELIRNLGKLLKRVTFEEHALTSSMPDSVVEETMMSQYDDGFPPLRIYAKEPEKEQNSKFEKTSAKFKNACQIRLIGHRLHTSITVLFNSLMMLPTIPRHDYTMDSYRGFTVLICEEISKLFCELCDQSLFDKPDMYLILIYTAQYCLIDPNSDKMLTIGAIMFMQSGGFLQLKEGLLYFWKKMNSLDSSKIAEIKDLSYVKNTKESIYISIVMNTLVFFNKASVYESLTTVSNPSYFYEPRGDGTVIINVSSLSASFVVQSKLLGFGVLERLLDEEVFGSFDEDQPKIPDAVISEVITLTKHVYSNSGERNLNQSDGSLFRIDWKGVKSSRSKLEYFMNLGLSQSEAASLLSKSIGGLNDLDPEDLPRGITDAIKWKSVCENYKNTPYVSTEAVLAEAQYDHYHTFTELEDVRQMKNDFILDQILLLCQLYPKFASSQVSEFLLSSFLGTGKNNVAIFETNILHTILEFIYSFEITDSDSKSLSAMLRLFCALISHDTVFYGSHSTLENFTVHMSEVLKPEFVNCDWFGEALSALVKIMFGSNLPDLEKLTISTSLLFTPKVPACYKVDPVIANELLDIVIAVPDITRAHSALPLCRLLSVYACDSANSQRITKSGVIQKLLKAIAYPKLEDNEKPFVLHSAFVYLVRKCYETESIVREFIDREITRQYQSRSKKEEKLKSKDLALLLKDSGGAVLRAPDVFIDEFSKRARFTDFSDSGLKSLVTKLLEEKEDDVNMTDVDAPKILSDTHGTSTPLEDQTGVVHLLLTELMSTAKQDWFSDPAPTDKEKEQLEKEKEKAEIVKPPKVDVSKNEHCSYMIFLLKVITELLASYKQSKLEFLTFSKKQLFQASVDEAPKPRSTSLNFFLHQLILDVNPENPEAEKERKTVISDLAQGAIMAFVSTVDGKSLRVDPKQVDPDMTFIRKFSTDTIHKVIKDAITSPLTLKSMTLKVSSLCKLLQSLLKGSRAKYLDPLTTEFDSYYIAVTVIDSNVPSTLTAILSDIDLNYVGHAFLLDSILGVMGSLGEVKVAHQDLFKSLNPASGADEEEVEEDENDFKEETPDLFQNSTLGMYDVAEIDSEDDYSDENISYDEEDEEDDEEIDDEGSLEIVYSDDDEDGIHVGHHIIADDEGELVISDDDSLSGSGSDASDSEEDEDMDSGSDGEEGFIRYDIVPEHDIGDDEEEMLDDESGSFVSEGEEHYIDDSGLEEFEDEEDGAEIDQEPTAPGNGTILELDTGAGNGQNRAGTDQQAPIWRIIQNHADDEEFDLSAIDEEGDAESSFTDEDEDDDNDDELDDQRIRDLQDLTEHSRFFSRSDRGRGRAMQAGIMSSGRIPTITMTQLLNRHRHNQEGSRPSSLEAYYNYFVDLLDRSGNRRPGFDFLSLNRGRQVPSDLKIMSTRDRYNSFVTIFFTKNDPARVMHSIMNRIYTPSREAYESRRAEEAEALRVKEEEAKKLRAEIEEKRRIEEEEKAAAAAAAALEAGDVDNADGAAEPEREPVWVMIGDREVDISGTDIDPEFFEALPDYMREEVFTQHVRERRAQASQAGEAAREIDQDFLDALPENIREEIITQEMEARRPGIPEVILQDPEITTALDATATTDTQDKKKEEKQKMFFTPLIDKHGVASLVRYIFSPRSFSGRRALYSLFGQLCINKHTRAEVLGLLLSILQEGIGSQESLERVFNQISMRSKWSSSSQQTVSTKLSGTPRTPLTPLQPKPSSGHDQFPQRASPFVIACQVLEALQFLLESDPQLRYYFLTEHESITLLKKSSSAKKPHLVKPSKYPLNALLGLLEFPIVKQKSVLMDLLSRIVQITTRPLNAMKKAQESKDHKKKIELPNVMGTSLRNVVTILVSNDCSSRTFQQTLSAMQNLLVVKAHNIFSNELSKHSNKLAGSLVKDLQEMVELLKSNGEDANDFDAAVMLKFTSSSSDQSKLLRVLTALDYLFGKKDDEKDGDSKTTDNKELTKLYTNLSLGSLWGSLSDSLDLFEENKSITHIATTLLPLIEALMVVCKHSRVKELQAKESLKYESSKCDFTNEPIENLFFSFTNKHKKILNQMVRSNAKLMSGPFAMLVSNPKILEFDNKKNYFDRQLHSAEIEKSTLAINVRRDQVFLDSYRSLFFKPKDEFRNAKLDISFKGEAGVDAGGVTREWYQVLSRQMFNPDYALFLPVAGDKTTFHPNRTSWVNPEHLSFFKFIGRIIGKAIFDGCFLDCHFSRDVYKSILGRSVSLKDLESIDLEYYKSLMWMLENDITDIIIETFSVETDDYGEVKVIDLIPDGRNISVTEENKHDYVRLVVEYRIQKSVAEQVDNFLQGFREVIPKELIAIFDEQELELLISGLPDIDVDDWKNNTTYVNYNASSKEIGYFWRAVRSFDAEERAKLLQFATGTSKVPLNGFKELEGASGSNKFSIHKDFGATDRLPSSHTCFNQIDLPAYDSYETLRRALLLAITEGHEGFGLA